MTFPYVTFNSPSGTGPFSYASISLLNNITHQSQLAVFKNSTLLLPGAGPGQADYLINENTMSITFTDALILTDTLEIRRQTDDLISFAAFTDGARLRAEDLNKAFTQLFFLIQEKSLYSTTIVEFPISYIQTSGWLDGDTMVWDKTLNGFINGLPTMALNDLADVTLGTASQSDVLTWSAGTWQALANTSFDPTATITFTGDVSFSGNVTVPTATTDNEAVNKLQAEGIVTEHATTYNAAMLARIAKLETDSRSVLARGRYWNTIGDYHCRWKGNPSPDTTVPPFDTNAARAGYDNLKNLVCSSAGYVVSIGTHVSPKGTHTDLSNQVGSSFSTDHVYYDVFYWDFSFEDSTIVPPLARAGVPHQYHVSMDVEGLDDNIIDGTLNTAGMSIQSMAHIFGGVEHTNEGAYVGGTNPELRIYAAPVPINAAFPGAWEDGYPFLMDGHVFAKDPGLQHYSMQRNEGNTYPVNERIDAGWNTADARDLWVDDDMHQYRARSNQTEPIAGTKICNKDEYGFTVLYYIRRPLTWEWMDRITSAEQTSGVYSAPYSSYQPFMQLNKIGTAWYSYPLPINFNFNITVYE